MINVQDQIESDVILTSFYQLLQIILKAVFCHFNKKT